jgi:two-component system, chemotaxis family, protein-glutamate methylesterase/glutaminase
VIVAKVRVLVVDDSALVRKVLKEGLNKHPQIEVVDVASDPFVARDKIVQLKPDVMTLDVEMPRMDGIEFLRKLLPQWPMPVIMVSSLTEAGGQVTLDALSAGAVDFVTKPTSSLGQGLIDYINELSNKILAARFAKVRPQAAPKPGAATPKVVETTLVGGTDKVIALGASTGGTEALREVLLSFPRGTPGVVVVQHMPPKFTQMYAERIDKQCQMEVREAKDGDRVIPGRVLIAPGGLQMRVVRSGGQYKVTCSGDQKVSGHCPSVDVLFRSVAEHVGPNAVGAILTGMGADGAEGLFEMRQKGAMTFGQDEASCVVYGMPKVAFERGGVARQLPLEAIGPSILHQFSAAKAKAG